MRHSNYQPTPNFLLSLRSSAWTIFPVVRPRANKRTKKNPTSARFSKTTRDGKRIVFPLQWSLKRRSLVGGSCPISQTLAPDLSFRVRLRRRGYIYTDLDLHGENTILFYILLVSFKQPAVNVSLEFSTYPLHDINRLTVEVYNKNNNNRESKAGKIYTQETPKGQTKNHRQKHQTTNIVRSDRNRLFTDFDLLCRCKLHPEIFTVFSIFQNRYIRISDFLCSW